MKNVRTAEPFMVRKIGPRGGTYTLREIVDKYDNVVSGKATPVKLPPDELKKYRKLGYETTKDRVIIPKAAGEKVGVTPQGQVTITHPAGIHRIKIPVEYHNLAQYLRDIKGDAKKIDRMKAKGQKFAFNYFGFRSLNVYAHIDQLIEDLEERYQSLMTAVQSGSAAAMNEVYRNLEIVATTVPAWEKAKQVTRRSRTHHARAEGRKKLKRLQNNPFKLQEYRRKKAAAAREFRANMSPAQKAAYKSKAKVRAKKSRS